MITSRTLRAVLVLSVAALSWSIPVRADLVAPGALTGFGLQRTWEVDLKLPAAETVSRISLLDDSLYVLTNSNRVYAVHAPTGIIRWSALLAEDDQALRGPSHATDYVFFTTGGTVIVLNRRTGELANEPRSIDGVVIEVQHDTALISVGEAHGVRAGDTLTVYRPNEVGEVSGAPLARLKLTSVMNRNSSGKLTRLEGSETARPGDRVVGDLELPLDKVKLPFAASCAAVADEKRIYVGAANQRFYSLDILQGYQYWQLMTPNTVASTPVLFGGNLYFAGLDGRVVSCTKDDRVRNWEFETEGPVFADVVVNNEFVYIASGDRSLYCFDRVHGKRRWRVRFDTPLLETPLAALDRVYQTIPEEGLYALDARTGEQLWVRRDGGQFLLQLGRTSYVLSAPSREVLKVSTATGSVEQTLNSSMIAFAAASQADQAIYLVSAGGHMACLRSKDAPRLRPSQVVDVLRNDRRAKIGEDVEAARRAAIPKEAVPARSKLPDYWFEEDWLTSKSTAKPIGGRALAGEAEPPAKPERPTAVKKGEEAEEDGAAEDDEESAEESSDEEMEDEGDSADEEGSEDDESADSESPGEDEEEADDESDESGDSGADEDDEESSDEDADTDTEEEGGDSDEESPEDGVFISGG